jgi:hypothetical protein
MDKGIHKPFKQYIREESNAWMVAHQQGDKLMQVAIATWINMPGTEYHILLSSTLGRPFEFIP